MLSVHREPHFRSKVKLHALICYTGMLLIDECQIDEEKSAGAHLSSIPAGLKMMLSVYYSVVVSYAVAKEVAIQQENKCQ